MELSFFEIVIVAFIALLVLGPEELVRKASTLGRWVGRLRTEMNNWKIMAEEKILSEDRRVKSEILSKNDVSESFQGTVVETETSKSLVTESFPVISEDKKIKREDPSGHG